jgi:gliding motility-associated-like protein
LLLHLKTVIYLSNEATFRLFLMSMVRKLTTCFMKHYTLLILLTAALAGNSFAQTTETHYFNSADYAVLKAKGELPAGNVIELGDPIKGTPTVSVETESAPMRAASCGCYITPDASYTLAMGPNDDLSTGLIALPFTFCLYGTNYNSLYINNNGNVSFGTAYGTFSAAGFPSASYTMVAPFWGDVDTRPAGGGTVKYKIYPNAIYINWDGVGYYSMMTDKLNTFQLILSDGTDTTIGVGNNVAFCYEDMQWTTGAASSGIGGFGGVPATVGANEGDGISYIQFGRFDHAGTDYDGPVGSTDGISWLDYQSFKFSTCVTTSNVEPVFIDFSPDLANLSYDCGTGDTIKICATGDTLIMSAQVFDANPGDVVTMSISSPSPFTILSNVPGNPATISWSFVATGASAGFNTFTVTATDNGTPPLSASASVQIYVDTTGTGAFSTNILGDTLICNGETTILNVPALFDTYEWFDGSATEVSGTITAEGDYWVTLSNNSCYKTISQHVYELPAPEPVVLGSFSLCGAPSTLLTSQDPYVTYNWTLNGAPVSSGDTASIGAPGTVVLTVTDTNGCVGDSTYTVVSSPTINVTGPTSVCSPATIDLLATPNTTGTYLWSNGDTDSLATATTTGMYVVVFTDLSGCSVSDSQFVDIIQTPNIFITTSDSVGCVGDILALTVGGTTFGGTILWSTTETTSSINVSSGTTYSVTVTNSGCTDTDNITVLFNPSPTVSITGPTETCANIPITITATGIGSGTYLWSTGETTTTITPTSTGVYTVTFTDANGCSGTDSQTETLHPVPNADFTFSSPSPVSPSSLPFEVDFTSTSTIGSPGTIVSYTYTVNDTIVGVTGVTSFEFTHFGIHDVTLYVVSDEGCIDSVSYPFEVAPILLIPNVFTPNSTPGYNDVFEIESLYYFAPATLKVFDRWGVMVYESSDYKNDWGGTKNGKSVAEGVYYYELVLVDGHAYPGYVHITRGKN